MRIALIHYAAPPIIGGVERVIAQQAKVLAENGHEVVIFCGNADACSPAEGIQVRVIPWLGANHEEEERIAGGDAEAPADSIPQSPQLPSFLDPAQEIHKQRHQLPHWQQSGKYVFVSWRLADSLPQHLTAAWRQERDIWLNHHPKPWDAASEQEYYRRFTERMQRWLDKGHGSCILRKPAFAEETEKHLLLFNGQRYDLRCFVIMPNHVHVLFRLRDGWPLETVIKGWKEWSTQGMNALMGQGGELWAKGYFDRLIRSGEHFERVERYIRNNPVKAGLEEGFVIWESGGGIEEVLGEGGEWWGKAADGTSADHEADDTSAFHGFDVAIVHNMFTMPFNAEAALELARLSRILTNTRFINWVHDVDVPPETFLALNLRATHVAVSRVRQAEFCAVAGLPLSDCRVVPNGIDPEAVLGLSAEVADLARRHGLWERDLVLFHPTRVLARKNLELGIEVVAALRRLKKDAVLVITGAPDPHRRESAQYAAAIRKQIAKLKMRPHVIFAGESFAVSDRQVAELYSVADALFFPSRREGFGLPLLEAAMHRLPVFCSDIPIHREVLGRKARFFSLDEDPAAIAALIVRAMERDAPSHRRKVALGKFSWARVYKDCIKPLLRNRRAKVG